MAATPGLDIIAGSHDGHLGYVSAAGDALAAQAAHIALDELHRGVRVVAGYGEGDILAVLTADGLQDYVHVDIFLCQQIEEPERHAGSSFRPITEILAVFLSSATPLINILSTLVSSLTIVPS